MRRAAVSLDFLGSAPLVAGATVVRALTFLLAILSLSSAAQAQQGGITALTGDATASGTGSVVATVGSLLGGKITLSNNSNVEMNLVPPLQSPAAAANSQTFGFDFQPSLIGPSSSASGYYAGIFNNLVESGAFGNWVAGDNLAIWNNLEVDGSGALFAAKGLQSGISMQSGSTTIANANGTFNHIQMNAASGSMTNFYGFQTYVSGSHKLSITNYEDFNCEDTHAFVLSNAWCVRNDDSTKMNFNLGPSVQAGNAIFNYIGMYASPTAFTKSGYYPLLSATAPTVATGFASGGIADVIATNQGSAAFQDTVGTTTIGTTTTLTLKPAAARGWVCDAHDLTTHGIVLDESGTTTTSVSFISYGRTTGTATPPNAGDVLAIKCSGF